MVISPIFQRRSHYRIRNDAAGPKGSESPFGLIPHGSRPVHSPERVVSTKTPEHKEEDLKFDRDNIGTTAEDDRRAQNGVLTSPTSVVPPPGPCISSWRAVYEKGFFSAHNASEQVFYAVSYEHLWEDNDIHWSFFNIDGKQIYDVEQIYDEDDNYLYTKKEDTTKISTASPANTTEISTAPPESKKKILTVTSKETDDGTFTTSDLPSPTSVVPTQIFSTDHTSHIPTFSANQTSCHKNRSTKEGVRDVLKRRAHELSSAINVSQAAWRS